jgi:hypothetical protein
MRFMPNIVVSPSIVQSHQEKVEVRPTLVSRAGGVAMPSPPSADARVTHVSMRSAQRTFDASSIAQPNAQSVTLAVVTAFLRQATRGTSMRGTPRFIFKTR